MKKNILSVVMVIFIITGSVLPVYAEQAVIRQSAVSSDNQDGQNAKITKETAKDIAAKFLKDFCEVNVNEKKYEIRSTFRQDYGSYGPSSMIQSYIWELNYQYNDGNKSYNITVTVDSNSGKIKSFNRSEYNYRGEQSTKVSVITEEQAKEIARAFIEKVYPGLSSQIISDNNGLNKIAYVNGISPQYSFNYIRVVNGLKFDANRITVGVNGITGNISSLYYIWNDDLSFPTAKSSIDSAKAKEIYLKEAEMKLSYVTYSVKNYFDQPTSAKLVYGAEYQNGSLIDAQNGNMINVSSNNVVKTKDLNTAEKQLFIEKWKKPADGSQELDEKKASEIALTYIKEIFGQSYEINSINFDDSSNTYGTLKGKKTWSVQFTNKKSGTTYGQPSGNIVLNAESGQLITINMYKPFEMPDATPFTPKLTWEDAYNKAIDVIAEYFPDKVKDINTEQNYIKLYSFYNGVKMPEQYYSFNFARQVNGIPYGYNTISISFDIKTGEIRSIYSNWDDSLKFPETQQALNKDEAKDSFFKIYTPELVYTLVNKSNDIDKPDYEVKLVYRLKSSAAYSTSPLIDAFTGKQFNFFDDIDMKINTFNQTIKGHWGEKELGILAYQGIINMENFKPDQEITRLEAIKLLVNAKGYIPYNMKAFDSLKFTNIDKNNDSYKYLQLAVQYGLIENVEGKFMGEDKITREEMAELIVKLLKYDRLAKSRDIFTLPYSDSDDISSDRYGYVAIGTGLGFFIGDNGKFRPKDNTTMAEFAITVYKALDLMKN